jgi:hypothetical protein
MMGGPTKSSSNLELFINPRLNRKSRTLMSGRWVSHDPPARTSALSYSQYPSRMDSEEHQVQIMGRIQTLRIGDESVRYCGNMISGAPGA